MATIEELIRLLDYPNLLESNISQLKLNKSNDEVEKTVKLTTQFQTKLTTHFGVN